MSRIVAQSDIFLITTNTGTVVFFIYLFFCVTPTNTAQWLWILTNTPNLLLTLLNSSERATEKRSLCLLTIALLCKFLFPDSRGNIKVNNSSIFLLLSPPIPKMSALTRWTGRAGSSKCTQIKINAPNVCRFTFHPTLTRLQETPANVMVCQCRPDI